MNMSCDIVSDLTISAIVCAMAGTEYGAAGLHDENDGTFYSAATSSQKVGQMLLDANFASVNARYNENAPVRVFKMKSKREILIFMQIRLFSMSSIIRGHRSGLVVLKELSNAIPTPI